ncbi:MAG TPA: helix-turn-helix domain-containing protein [Nocardioides sp.]|uniref:helix-turn-helix transcriptional regulator n=1 Tax=Nocardioides sp. TaxID=35761 RepID=UPI002C4461B0|nr:helix-turn-helix domain-containing protein [Nocardioides sp.]HTW15145.1 helix-turn-helix domain-containing protein [Nocardioides sp.]
MDDLLTTEEVAGMVRSSEGTLRYWRSVNRGPRSAKIGKRVVYRRSDVEAWIEAQFDQAVGDDLAAAGQ